MKHRFYLGALLCAALASLCHAQNPTGTLEGQITAPNGDGLSTATASVRNLQTGYVRSQAADGAGLFRFSLLRVGDYELTVAAHSSRASVRNRSTSWSVRRRASMFALNLRR